jgi:Zn-finger nucleic acid-binding protein
MVELRTETYKGIEVDRCAQCQGMWLDYPELDQLEDTVMEDDQLKGSMMFRSHGSELACPRCEGPMRWFRYRHYDLELDFCEAEHGFWLDKGEEKRVLQIMEQRLKDVRRSASAEVEWGKFLSNVRSKSFLQKVKDLFKG